MQQLNFDEGMIELAIQGDEGRVLRFIPSDSKISNGFLNLIQAVKEKLNEFATKENEILNLNLSDLEKAKKMTELSMEIDLFFRGELDSIFGNGTSNLVFGDVCTSAITKNGQCIFINFIYALLPIFEKEIKVRNEKISQIIKENRP